MTTTNTTIADAEAALIGAILLDPSALHDVENELGHDWAESFVKPDHQAAFDVVANLIHATGYADTATMVQKLQACGYPVDLAYLVGLAENVMSPAGALYHARIVHDAAIRRRLAVAGEAIRHRAQEAGDDSSQALANECAAILTTVTDAAMGESRRESLTDVLGQMMDELENADAAPGWHYGLSPLDELTLLRPGELTVLAARPSMGKTAFGLQVALRLAKSGVRVGFISLEMTLRALAMRWASAISGVPMDFIQRRQLRDIQAKQVAAAMMELSAMVTDGMLTVDARADQTALQVRSKARQWKRAGVQVLILDYLQLLQMPGDWKRDRVNEVGAISRTLAATKNEMDMPILCLAQLNRASVDSSVRRPRMSDLRESGSIEQDADVVMLLHREEYYHKGDEDWECRNADKIGMAELIVDKNRNGPTGTAVVRFDGPRGRFEEA